MNKRSSDLPEKDHIVRYVKPTALREDGSADGSAFLLRLNHKDDAGLSVNWLEVFGHDKRHQLEEVRRLCRLKLSRAGRFVEMNIGTVTREIAKERDSVRIVHKPLEPKGGFEADPSHAEISGLPPGNSDEAMLIGDLIAQCIVSDHPTFNC
ncbi:MAG: hypothetical protein F4227_08790 [Gammaproteobacteria bacterium]|nr:hypothetical protein [Gammaproteobacteria bacterium]MYF03046.1 hypothetical protein [Gammaproteobacteria bacterium]MYI77048.1 hypothetical protein [Gammaproteobacteria bacterium]